MEKVGWELDWKNTKYSSVKMRKNKYKEMSVESNMPIIQ